MTDEAIAPEHDDSTVAGTPAQPAAPGDIAAVARLRAAYARIRAELTKVIVGQESVVDQLLIALFARGHVILEGVPGLAKTLMISSLARCLGLQFQRIQFTPDLMPSDITGTEVIQEDRRTGSRAFRFLPGPVFTNVLLADEVNRTPPKTQAALLEAMQEGQVTAGGQRHPLDPPFFVLATQNPIEQEGTYPLPEAQQDRFMFKVLVDYPAYDEEFAIAQRTTGGEQREPQRVLERDEILQLQAVVRRVPTPPSVVHYALRLVRATRPGLSAEIDGGQCRELIERLVLFGAGPRAVQFLLLAGKVRAVFAERNHVAVTDIQAVACPVMRHRIITNYAAEAEGFTTDRIIQHLLETLPTGAAGGQSDRELREVLKS
jgi:MoxR-like ATPase